MTCTTFDRIEEGGSMVSKPKKQFDTMDAAIAVAKIENAKPNRINKVVAYKCDVCFKYHIGRNGKELTYKEKEKLKKELELDEQHKKALVNNPLARIKTIGWVDLSKVKY